MAVIRSNADQSARLDLLGAARFGVNRTDARAIELLARLGPMTAKQLAGHLGMTTGGVTTVIDRLEKAGYVRRRHDLKDRRRVLLETTDLQSRREREIFGDLVEGTLRVVSSYDDAQLEVVGRFLEEIGATVAAHSDQLEKKNRGRRGAAGLRGRVTAPAGGRSEA
jgi:DNA-binding MarR family transcriptional regulator